MVLFTLPATVIEIAPHDGYSTVIFQLANAASGDPSTGSVISIQIVDTSALYVDQVIQLPFEV